MGYIVLAIFSAILLLGLNKDRVIYLVLYLIYANLI